MIRTLNTYPDAQTLAFAAADQIVQTLGDALASRARASLVLTGGSTPRLTYTILADRHRSTLDWQRIDVFWGDERYVPHDHPESNYRMAVETLLARIQPGHVYPIPTAEESSALTADKYEETILSYFDGSAPAFDLTLLGLGDDGHVASLFPGADDLEESERLVVATAAPEGSPIRDRISITFAALNASRNVLFIVEGSRKQQAVRRTFSRRDTPAARIKPARTLTWLLDEAAYGTPASDDSEGNVSP